MLENMTDEQLMAIDMHTLGTNVASLQLRARQLRDGYNDSVHHDRSKSYYRRLAKLLDEFNEQLKKFEEI